MSDHERIWLQPECCADPIDGRMWREDPDPVDCDAGVPWTEYVRADLLAALEKRIAELERDAVDKACAWDAIAQKNARIAELEARWNASDVLIGIIEDENKELRARIAKLQKERDLLFKAHHHEMMRADTAEARGAALEAALQREREDHLSLLKECGRGA